MLDLIPGGSSARRGLGFAVDAGDAIGDTVKRVDPGSLKHAQFNASKVSKVDVTPKTKVGRNGELPTIQCFAPETLVATPEGQRPIGEIQKGDRVYAYDPQKGG